MICKVDENIVLLSRIKSLPGPKRTVHLFSFQHLQKDVGPDTATNVIFWHAVVNIGPVRVVDDLAWCGVLFVVCNVIVHHDYDVVVWNPMCVHDLVGVADVRLMPVVEPAITASYKQNPELAILLW